VPTQHRHVVPAPQINNITPTGGLTSKPRLKGSGERAQR
jgi:hypothetical protein